MKFGGIRNWKTLAAGLVITVSATALAEAPTDHPFAMRGVELGITLEEFRQATIPNDEEGRYGNLQAWCSTDDTPRTVHIEIDSADRADGLVNCQWFSADRLLGGDIPWPHWVKIGEGGGWPIFHFMKQNGQMRLFRISFYANIEYYNGILDALTRGYGAPVVKIEPFKTEAGGDFTSATNVWDNGLSSITLIQRCGHLERYCLTYDHAAFAKSYHDIQEQRAAAAATKI